MTTLRRAAVRAKGRTALPFGGDYCAMPDCGIDERLHIVEFGVNRFVACSNCRRRLNLDGRNAVNQMRFPTSIIGCSACGFADPCCWEVHHIDGVKRSDRCTALCLVHHEIVSEIQKDNALTDGVADILRLRRQWRLKRDNVISPFIWWHESDRSTVFEIAE